MLCLRRLLLTLVLAITGSAAGAEPVTPWGVARTVLPDAPDAPEPAGPPVAPMMTVGGFGAVMGPGVAPRLGAMPAAGLPRPRSPEVPAEPVPPGLNPLAEALAALQAVRERPLFSPSRRPPRPAPALVAPVMLPAPVPPPAPPNLRLIGVVEDAESASGVVRRAGGGAITVRMGDPIDGWSVGEIGPGHITLRSGEQVQTYRLFAVGVPTGTQPRSTAAGGGR